MAENKAAVTTASVTPKDPNVVVWGDSPASATNVSTTAAEEAKKKEEDALRENFKKQYADVKTAADTELASNRIEKSEILKAFGGVESNIPLTHRYWQLRTS